MALKIGFDHNGLDPKVVNALDDIVTAIQTWSASPFGLSRKRLRASAATQTITTGTDPFSVTWQIPTVDPAVNSDGSDSTYDTGGFLDSGGVFLNFSQVGTYLINAEIWFAGSAVGNRYVGIFGTSDLDSRKQVQRTSVGAANESIDSGVYLLHVSSPGAKVRVGVYQNSGGGLSLVLGRLQVLQVE